MQALRQAVWMTVYFVLQVYSKSATFERCPVNCLACNFSLLLTEPVYTIFVLDISASPDTTVYEPYEFRRKVATNLYQ